jgi:peptidyl-dipeptidase A
MAFLGGFVLVGAAACNKTKNGSSGSPDERARSFINRHLEKTRPLEKTANLAWWQANISGKAEDFKAKEDAENALDKILSDPRAFEEVKSLKDRGGIADPLLKRQIDLIYLSYLGKQADPQVLRQIVAKSNAVERAFNVYRAPVGDTKLTENDVRKILRESRNSPEREQAWKASKGVGRQVEPILRELVKLRNQMAQRLGFRDYYMMSLYLNEQDEGALLALFDQLDELTRKPFLEVKARLDRSLARRFNIPAEKLRPWHYEDPFFQQAPQAGGVKLDKLYAGKDILKISRDFYAGIGLPVEEVLKRSDLYERDGKSPHAFSTDIDREGDIRVLANIRPNDYWMNTMLHELGHAVYSENIDRQLPYPLRTEAHILATEGIAMMFGRVNKRAEWLRWALGLDKRRAARYGVDASRQLRTESLIFSRWCQVMLHFERAMYGNPDQDLNRLWWDLVEKYQGLHRPENRSEPDYAAKIHLVTAPVYYHNYMMGELFASQVHHALARQLGIQDASGFAYVGRPEVGRFLKEKVFGPGARYPWNELTKLATGEALSANDYAQDFVKEMR